MANSILTMTVTVTPNAILTPTARLTLMPDPMTDLIPDPKASPISLMESTLQPPLGGIVFFDHVSGKHEAPSAIALGL
ncbi:hypothetical protein J3459_008300 [Metarhizium acridum]|nr:hypothetical protein J3459_008300 [Metarhizium acridum]